MLRAHASRICLVLAMFGCLHPVVRGQVAGGTITGTVSDRNGAVVSDAEVKIENHSTGISRTLTTNSVGLYTAPNLNPGEYDLTVSASGFERERGSVSLAIGAEVVSNFAINIQSQVVITVEATAPTVELGSSLVRVAVQEEAVRELPLNGRDWTMLAALEPNVHTVDTQNDIALGSNARANRGWGSQLMIGGNRPQQNVYLLDGVVMNDFAGGGPGGVLGSSLGVDSIQEFSVVTGNASSEYGRTSGGVINAITRSGTNGFHGSVYEFLRNSALDARNYFDGPSVPPFKRNQFGGSLGGPLYKNRTFFFGNYEGLRQVLSVTSLFSVPSTAARSGQLTSGKVVVDPKVAPFLSLYPLPNAGENGDVGTARLVGSTRVGENLYTFRGDQSFTDKDYLHGSFQSDRSSSSGPDAFGFTQLAMLSTRKLVSIEEGHLFTTALANFLRLGYSRSVSLAPETSGAIDPRAADPTFGFGPGQNVGVIQTAGLTSFQGGVNGQSTFVYHYNSYQLDDDIFWTKGAHSLKFGAAVEQIQSNNFSSGNNGNWMFGSLRNFLLNQPTSFVGNVVGGNSPVYMRQAVAGFYADDDWRVHSRLALNLGLRYEFVSVPSEKYNKIATLPSLTASAPKIGSPLFNNPTLLDFSPRIGFSWDPLGTGNTAIRGGFGIYDNLPLTYQFGLITLNSAPFFLSGTVSSGLNGKFPNGAFASLTPQVQKYAYIQQDPGRMYVMQWNLNIQRALGWGLTATAGYNGAHGVHEPTRANDENIVLPVSSLANGTPVWPFPRNSGARQNPNVGTIDSLVWNGSSIYHAMQLSVTRHQRRLLIGGSFTWSKSIDDTSSSVGGSNFNNSLVSPWIQFPKLFRGLSDFDQRYNLTLHALWQIPSAGASGFAGKVVGGWQLSPIVRLSAGLPFTPTIGGDPLGLKNNNAFGLPDRLFTGNCNSLVNPGNPLHYIKTECFSVPPGTQLGNSRRNDAIGPGLTTLDLSLVKNMPIAKVSENFVVQFRTEFFNTLNHANFRTPDRTASQIFNVNGSLLPNAGVITSTSTTSRQLQFALRLSF